MNAPLMYYLQQPPKKYTFEQPLLRQFVEENCDGRVLNLFACKTLLDVDETRVDLSNEFQPDYCMDSFDFVIQAKEYGCLFDTIVLDPPYSLRKSMEKYKGKTCSHFTKIINELPSILTDGGKVISLGYQSRIMGKTRGFTLVKICLISHGGSHHDTICTIEQKIGGWIE